MPSQLFVGGRGQQPLLRPRLAPPPALAARGEALPHRRRPRGLVASRVSRDRL
jgi:hypothetical protein